MSNSEISNLSNFSEELEETNKDLIFQIVDWNTEHEDVTIDDNEVQQYVNKLIH